MHIFKDIICKIYEDFKYGFWKEPPDFLIAIKLSKEVRKFILSIFPFIALAFLFLRNVLLIKKLFGLMLVLYFTIFGIFALLFYSLKVRNYKNINKKTRFLLTHEQTASSLCYIFFVLLFFLIKL